MQVAGEAGDSVTAVAVAAREHPDIVLLDIEIPGGEVTATSMLSIRRRNGSSIPSRPAAGSPAEAVNNARAHPGASVITVGRFEENHAAQPARQQIIRSDLTTGYAAYTMIPCGAFFADHDGRGWRHGSRHHGCIVHGIHPRKNFLASCRSPRCRAAGPSRPR